MLLIGTITSLICVLFFNKLVRDSTLTRALLKRDFGLELTLLDDRLCPPVRVDLSQLELIRIMSIILRFQTGRCGYILNMRSVYSASQVELHSMDHKPCWRPWHGESCRWT